MGGERERERENIYSRLKCRPKPKGGKQQYKSEMNTSSFRVLIYYDLGLL